MSRTERRRELLPRILPVLLILLAAAALGEAVGYLFGLGDTYQKLDAFEFSGELLEEESAISPAAIVTRETGRFSKSFK